MKCKNLHKKLIFFLEKELPQKEMEFIEMHLSACSTCASFAEELKKTLGVLEAEKSPDVNPFFHTRLKAKIENQEPERKQVFWRPTLVRILQPALFSILLIAGIYTGIKIGQTTPAEGYSSMSEQHVIPYLNEMEVESIEIFLME